MKFPGAQSIGLGLIAASLLPLSHGAKLYTAQSTFLQESRARQAVVVDLQSASPVPGEPRGRELYSVVDFTDDTGALRRAQTNVGSYPAPQKIGDRINIRFSLRNQNDVRVDSFTGIWFESAFYLIPGLLTLLGGLLILVRSRSRSTRTPGAR